MRDLPGYKYSESWIKQKHVRLEANRDHNVGVRRDSYENSKGRMEYTLVSRNQSLDWCQIVEEEIAICLWDLRKLYYGFGFYSLDSFFVFLD